MVGNISDMQAETPTRQYMPQTLSTQNITPAVSTSAATASTIKSRPGFTYFKIKVQMKRLTQKITMAMILYFCDNTSAACSSIPCDVNRWVPYWIMKVQHMICAPT